MYILKTCDLKLERLRQKVLVLPDISVKVGSHLLLLGESGCGKTTMLNLMAGLLRSTVGDVLFKDQAYSKLSDVQMDALRAKNFGFIFQRMHLIGHLTAAQNVALSFSAAGKKVDYVRIDEILKTLDLEDKKNAKAHDLSQGQAQRVAIARAVVHRPAVIFADEPTSALDDKNAAAVMDLLFTQAKSTGSSLIVSTHDARIKMRFENIMEMQS